MADSVTVQMREILQEYQEEVQDAANKAIDSTSKESVRKLKSASPKRPGGGKYARSWTLRKEHGVINTVTVYNREYQLTHLLENGHVIRNKYGTFGRTNGIKHIEPVEEWAQSELPSQIEREL